jgi:hypothetical protein
MGNFVRAGLVHRLDKETDGLMNVDKTETWLAHFKSLFQQKSAAATLEEKEATPLKKFYRATCDITPEWEAFLHSIANSLPHYIIKNVIPQVPHPVVKEGITKVLAISYSDTSEVIQLDEDTIKQRWLIHKQWSLPYHPTNIEKAKTLRSNMTPAETKLRYDYIQPLNKSERSPHPSWPQGTPLAQGGQWWVKQPWGDNDTRGENLILSLKNLNKKKDLAEKPRLFPTPKNT